MSNKNTLLVAIVSFVKKKFFSSKTKKKDKAPKEGKVSKGEKISLKDRMSFTKTNKQEKVPSNKLNIKKTKNSVRKTLEEVPKLPLRKRLPELVGFFSFFLTVVLSASMLTLISIADDDLEGELYETTVTKIQGDNFNVINPDQNEDVNFTYYDNLLSDGKLNFLTTKNYSATSKYGTDIFLARSKEEQYEFLRRNNNNIFLAWLIRQNTDALFSDYTSDELEDAITNISTELYASFSRAFVKSNATTLINYFQSIGYEDGSDYLERKLKPAAYIYFYLMDKMAKQTGSNDVTSGLNAKAALTSNEYLKTWGLKLSKNYDTVSQTSITECQDLGSISDTTPPTQAQWLQITNCDYVNGDTVLGQKSLSLDEVSGKYYTGYIGNLTLSDTSWFAFCDFVNAQLCSDLEYETTNSLVSPIYKIFLELANNTESFLKVNTYDVNLVDKEEDGKETLLIPYEDYYLILKTNRTLATNVYADDSTTKLDTSRSDTLSALLNIINGNASTETFQLFCEIATLTDFSLNTTSEKEDVEVFIFDEFTSLVFDSLCLNGVKV